MGKERQKRKELRQLLSPLTRFWRHDGKRYCAIALCASLIAGNIGHLAAAASEDPDYKFELDRQKLSDALQEAIANANVVQDGDLSFSGLDADTYQISLAADGCLYELAPEIEENDDDVSLRIFVRLPETELINDLDEVVDLEVGDTEASDGSENIYFLLINKTDSEKTVTIRVDNKETEWITVEPYSAVEMPEPEGTSKTISVGENMVLTDTEAVGPGAANTETEAVVNTGGSTTVSSGSSGGGSGSGGGGGSSGDGNTSVESTTENIEAVSPETEVTVENTEEVTEPETEAAVPETEIEMAEPETEAAVPETEAEATEPETEAPADDDVDVKIDIEDNSTDEDMKESDVTVMEDEKSDDATIDADVTGDATTDTHSGIDDSNKDEATGAEDTGTGTESGEYSSDGGEQGSDDSKNTDLSAAISLHKTYRVSSSKATPSNATPSDATPSDTATESFDGMAMATVRLGSDASAAAYVTTLEDVGITADGHFIECGAECSGEDCECGCHAVVHDLLNQMNELLDEVEGYTEETDSETMYAAEERVYEIADAVEAADITDAEYAYVMEEFEICATTVFAKVSAYHAATLEIDGAITVTFVVDNPDYTKDPDSGYTHLTVSEPIEESDLTFTKWTSSAYKVTGTGTVCSYEIPAGTSLDESDYSLPNISVTNIASGNAYTYISSRSWVTEDGMVCNADTVFDEDTTLYLSLYESSGGYYNLDFVCGCDGNHSISAALGGYPSATFSFGQSVSEPYIPTADAVNEGYTGTASCPHGSNYNETFVGWQLKVTDTGEMVDFAEGVPITETYWDEQYGNAIKIYPVWESPTDGESHTVVFHDIQPDGTESDYTLDMLVPAGDTISEAVADMFLEDDTPLSECVWYSADEAGEKTLVDLAATAPEDMELYTYTYQVTLALAPQSEEAAIMTLSLVEVETQQDGKIVMTITAREGEKLIASDFVVDGVDYSLYNWTYNGVAYDIQDLITGGVTENISIVSDGSLASDDVTSGTGTVNFYVCIEGTWTLLTSQQMTGYYYGESYNSYYLTAAQLESVYGDFGFDAGDAKAGTRLFPHTDTGYTTIWGDRTSVEIDGTVYFPILRRGVTCDVYYLPAASVDTYSGGRDSYTADNTFYKITVSDPANWVYEKEDIPDVQYVRKGTEVNVSVDNGTDVTWQCVGTDGSAVSGTSNIDKRTTSFAITNISQSYELSLVPVLKEGETAITYVTNLLETPSDEEYGRPLVEGSSTYTVVSAEEKHTILAPSLTSYFYESGKYLGEATFLGWAVNGDTKNLYQPDDVLALTDYVGTTVTLTAQWDKKVANDSNKNGSMVNFFVSLGAKPEGTTSWTGSTEVSTFTKSVYTVDCGVTGTDAVQQHLYTNGNGNGPYYVLGGTSGTNLNTNHTTITERLSNGYTRKGYNNKLYTYKATFPTDEEVLKTVRSMVSAGEATITINGKKIKASELIAENFTVKWYVFKYDGSDGWHIDGILVAKTGKMIVTKTFAGDDDAIEEIKRNYFISVNSETGQSGIVHTGDRLELNSDSYTSYDENTKTYTWEVDVDQYYRYLVTETNYESSTLLMTTSAQYNVNNSKESSENTSGWQSYTTGVTVTGRGYNEQDQERLTVAFLNTYTAPGTLILQKVDAVTGNRMSNVSFRIKDSLGNDFIMYSTGNGHYSAENNDGNPTSTITTDYSGQAYLWIGGGTYSFEEEVPTGYDDPGSIKVELEGAPNSNYKVIAITSAEAKNGEKFVTKDDTELELIIKNYSRTVDLKVEKIWLDNENKPVTIQLYRGAESMGSGYEITLNETKGWIHTFEKLPLYADGGLAQYTIREVALGDFKYSEEYNDGYRYYDVTYSNMVYLDENGDETSDMSAVKTIELSVRNQRSTGSLAIQKVDDAGNVLAGAEFYLYAVPDSDLAENANPSILDDNGNVISGITVLKTAKSDENGLVSFGNMDAGVYYLIEHAAPAGYEASSDLYRLVFTGTETVMYCWNSGGNVWETLTSNQVVNTISTIDVKITKVVAGIMGDRSKKFSFTVVSDQAIAEGENYTLLADGKTAEFSLSHNKSVILKSVPKGAALTIQESGEDGYKMTVLVDKETCKDDKYTIPLGSSGTTEITVKNLKEGDVDTGVLLDSMPYVLILAAVVAGVAFYFIRKKKDDEDDLD